MLSISDSQKEKLMTYAYERYSGLRYALMILSAIAVLLIIPAMNDFRWVMKNMNGETEWYHNSSRDGEMLVLWILILIAIGILIFIGMGKFLGSNTPKKCILRGAFHCEIVTVSRKDENKGKPPYRLFDVRGNTLECPVFLDFKNANIGSNLVGVFLDNGLCYAFAEETVQEEHNPQPTGLYS